MAIELPKRNGLPREFIERIPDEAEVRERLSQNLREAAMLRSLLRVAKKKTEMLKNLSPSR